MAVVSEKKKLELQRTMLIIRRCPFCLKDTEHEAYYARNPDLKVSASLNGKQFTLEYKGRMPFEWYGVVECKECGRAYVVQGVIAKLVKDITGITEPKEVMLSYTCCDFCMHDESAYTLANMLITLRNGKSIYLCERHAGDIKNEKGKRDNYDFLMERTFAW